jgi:peptidoglycan/xylan/chitin deacetylase (PgdA/CDA1 family)
MKSKGLFLTIIIGVLVILMSGGVIGIDIRSSNPNANSNIQSNNYITVTSYNQTWLDFDGIDDKINASNIKINGGNSANDKITISFWLKPILNVTNKRIIGKEQQIIFLWNGNKLRLIVRNQTTSYALDSTYTTVLNEWVHVIGRFDGTQSKIFINGIINNSGTVNSVIGLNISLQEFEIGGVLTSYSNSSIDEVIVLNDSLTPSQISRLFNSSNKRLGQSIPVLNYHGVDNIETAQYTVNLSEFEEQMSYLNSSGFTTITYKNILDWKNGLYILPAKPIILSFDDSRKDSYTNGTPIMDKYGFIGVMAIISNLVGSSNNYMNWSDINNLKNKGWELASHSINDTGLLGMSYENRIFVYQNTKDSIEGNITGYNVSSWIFPGGYRNITLDIECANYYDICGGIALTQDSAEFLYKTSNLTSSIPRMTITNDTNISQFEIMVDYNNKLLGFYNFNENTGTTVYDSSGNGNNGTITGATWNNDGIQVTDLIYPVLSYTNNFLMSPINMAYKYIISLLKSEPTYTLLDNVGAESYNLEIYNITDALIYNTNGSVYCGGLVSGNCNITLPPNNASYVLDNYNPTQTVSRENDPIWNGTNNIALNTLDQSITFPLTLNSNANLIYTNGTNVTGLTYGTYSVTLASGEGFEIELTNDLQIQICDNTGYCQNITDFTYNMTFNETADGKLNITITDYGTNASSKTYSWFINGVLTLYGYGENIFNYILDLTINNNFANIKMDSVSRTNTTFIDSFNTSTAVNINSSIWKTPYSTGGAGRSWRAVTNLTDDSSNYLQYYSDAYLDYFKSNVTEVTFSTPGSREYIAQTISNYSLNSGKIKLSGYMWGTSYDRNQNHMYILLNDRSLTSGSAFVGNYTGFFYDADIVNRSHRNFSLISNGQTLANAPANPVYNIYSGWEVMPTLLELYLDLDENKYYYYTNNTLISEGDLNLAKKDYYVTMVWVLNSPFGEYAWFDDIGLTLDVEIPQSVEINIIENIARPVVDIVYGNGTFDYAFTNQNHTINFSVADDNLDSCWINYNNVNTTIGGCNTTSFTLVKDVFTATIYANDTLGNIGNKTVNWDYKVFINNQSFEAIVYETQFVNLDINLSYNASKYELSVLLNYEGINYTTTGKSAGVFTSPSFQIPLINENPNKTYYWTITAKDLFNFTDILVLNTDSVNHTVSLLNMSFCGSPYSVRFLNFTFNNETLLKESVKATFSGDFTYSLSPDKALNKTFSYSSGVEQTNYSFCFTPPHQTVYASVSGTYANSYSEQRNFVNNSMTLTNSTYVNNLLLLPSSEGIYIVVIVQNQQLIKVPDALVKVYKVTDNTFVEQKYTDGTGQAAFFLATGTNYRIEIEKGGYSAFSTSLTPTTSPVLYTLTAITTASSGKSGGITIDIYPKNNKLENNTDYNFIFDIEDSTNELEEYGFSLWNLTTQLTGEQTKDNSGGSEMSINYNVGNQSYIVMKYFYIRNGEYVNGTYKWFVVNTAGTGTSIANFVSGLDNFIGNGTDGLFGIKKGTTSGNFSLAIIIFIIILFSAGLMTYKYGITAITATMFLITSVILFFDVGAGLIPTIGNIPHAITIIFAIITSVFFIKEVYQ